MMQPFRGIIGACWLVLVAYWLITAFRSKPSVATGRAASQVMLRIALLVLIVVIVRQPGVRGWLALAQRYEHHNVALSSLGTVLCVLGTLLALWARYHLGRNWGMPMTQRAEPELIRSGPYARVRHPIYGGLILLMLGSALGASIVWLPFLAAVVPYFVYSAHQEERQLAVQFPTQYPDYRRATRMFWPFLL